MAQNDSKAYSTEEINPKHYLNYVKDGEDMKLTMINYKVLPKSIPCENMIGKPYLISGSSLRTIDWSKTFNLLTDYKNDVDDCLSINPLKSDDVLNHRLLSTENLLTQEECMDAIKRCNALSLQELNDIPGYDRKSSRLVIFDKDFASLLWQRLEKPLTRFFYDEYIRLHPLGFNVTAGEWKFSGVNEAIRFNQYESSVNGMLAPHRDAQFCPSGNERSLLSLVIYLNDDFSGGETKFYFPNGLPQNHEKGFTMKQELELNGGLETGYCAVTVRPKCGNALLFSQNIIHESVPLIHSGQTQRKYILKTDIMLYRANVENGFTVSKEEEKDYVTCINLFRLAQQKELFDMLPPHIDNFKDIALNDIANESAELSANELYEKCLSLRYTYPTQEMITNWKIGSQSEFSTAHNSYLFEQLHSENVVQEHCKQNSKDSKPSALHIFPELVWDNIMRRLPEADKMAIMSIFSGLEDLKETWDIPKLQSHGTRTEGFLTSFTFPDADFVKSHLESIARMVALHSVFLLGTPTNPRFPPDSPDFGMYPVSYDPITNEAVAVEIYQFFRDIFYQRACYGAVFKVTQQGKQRDPLKDLSASVDRSLMMQRFGQEFTGCSNIARNFCENHKATKGSTFDRFQSKCHVLNLIDQSNPLDGLGDNVYSGNMEEIIDSKCLYKKGLLKCSQEEYVGGAIVRTLKKPVILGENSPRTTYCFCGNELFTTDQALSKQCDTHTFNHLIADFQKQEFTVRLANDKDDCCPIYSHDIPTNSDFTINEQLHFIVDISSLETNCKLSFNHAGCTCYMDKVYLDKYINLRSYPYMNHVHVFFAEGTWLMDYETDNKMYVWTCYGGIAVL